MLTSTLLTSGPSLHFPLSAAVPDNEALCVDLSPGYIYASMNSSSNDFLVRLMGGGGCVTDEADCAAGTREGGVLYSSAGMPTTSTGFGVLSGDASGFPKQRSRLPWQRTRAHTRTKARKHTNRPRSIGKHNQNRASIECRRSCSVRMHHLHAYLLPRKMDC